MFLKKVGDVLDHLYCVLDNLVVPL